MAAQAFARRGAQGNRFFRAGLPLVSLVVIGWFGLAQLVQVRAARRTRLRRVSRAHTRAASQGKTEVQDARQPASNERLPAAVQRRKSRFNLEAEHAVRMPRSPLRRSCCWCVTRSLPRLVRRAQRLKQAIDINNYQNKPVPRSR